MPPFPWHLPWISALEATRGAWLLALTLVQAITGWLGWLAAQSASTHSSVQVDAPIAAPPPFRLALGSFAACVGAASLQAAFEPYTLAPLLPLLRVAAPASGAALLALLAAGALLSRPHRPARATLVLASLGCAAGVALLSIAAALTATRLDPRLLTQPISWGGAALPLTAALLVPSAAAAVTLGVVVPERPQGPIASCAAPWIAAAAASCGALFLMGHSPLLPEELAPLHQRDAMMSGLDAHSWPSRLSLLAACSWVSAGWLLVATTRMQRLNRAPGAVVILTVIACLAANASWLARLGPWAVRGQVYANGVRVEDVTAHRRSTFGAPDQPAGEDAGALLYRNQCAPCHGVSPAGETTTPWRASDPVDARKFLEALREADRAGNEFHQRMPPLLGDDEQVDKLAARLLRR